MQITIIGNGIAGITAARHLRKYADHDICIISEESDFFFSRTSLMYLYMGHMRLEDTKPYEDGFWRKNRIELRRAHVTAIDRTQKRLFLQGGEQLQYDFLLLATGSKPRELPVAGSRLPGVQGLYHLQDLERMEKMSHGLARAVVVGGGLIGIEMAEMFHSRRIPVSFLVRESDYFAGLLPPEEAAMLSRHIVAHGIDLRLSTELRAILPGEDGRVAAVETSAGERIDCGFVGITVGVRPQIDFLRDSDSGLALGQGLLVDAFLRTSDPWIFAAGDCAELRQPLPGRAAVEALWYTGRKMGEIAAYNILCAAAGKETLMRPYEQGIWFNSAKFFAIEYQVYGWVPVRPTAGEASVFWQQADGQRSVRLVYDRSSGAVLGFNLLGVRFRQEVCERWIRERTTIDQVLAQLRAAHFDPEGYPAIEKQLQQAYRNQAGAAGG